jgi:p-hydroxybenzoate 3-monooxygenase
MRTQVGIVGAGPAGLFLSLLLQREGIDCVVLEAKSREYVESRVRAGVLEQGTVDLMDELGAGERLHRESMPDPRLDIRFSGGIIHIDLPVLTPGKIVTVYGQPFRCIAFLAQLRICVALVFYGRRIFRPLMILSNLV